MFKYKGENCHYCLDCCQIKPITEFYYDTYGKCYSSPCKQCSRKKRQQKRLKNPEFRLWECAKSRAEQKNLEFNLKLEDIIIPEFCPVLGVRLEKGKGKVSPSSPTLDKVNPNLGYTLSNTRCISYKANSIKSFGGLKEHRQIVDWLREKLTNTTDHYYI